MAAPPPSRPDLYVVLRLLDRLSKADDPMLRTHLQVGANLNYDLFARYLLWMIERGLVEACPMEDGKEGIGLTTKGREAYARLLEWIERFVKRPAEGQ